MIKDILLILGASSDIGIELIRRVDKAETVILAHYYNNVDSIESIKKESEAKIVPIKADLSEENDINYLIKKIEKEHGHPNKIVHFPAPKFVNIRFKNIEWDRFQKDILIQLKSIVLILKSFLPLMAKAKKGKVVFMLSSCTFNVPPKALSHYVTIKHALLGLMKSLASEYAEKHININAVSPSMIETKFLERIPDKIIEITAEKHPLKRIATPGDVVPAILFLLSEESNYINGINIPIAGGSVF